MKNHILDQIADFLYYRNITSSISNQEDITSDDDASYIPSSIIQQLKVAKSYYFKQKDLEYVPDIPLGDIITTLIFSDILATIIGPDIIKISSDIKNRIAKYIITTLFIFTFLNNNCTGKISFDILDIYSIITGDPVNKSYDKIDLLLISNLTKLGHWLIATTHKEIPDTMFDENCVEEINTLSSNHLPNNGNSDDMNSHGSEALSSKNDHNENKAKRDKDASYKYLLTLEDDYGYDLNIITNNQSEGTVSILFEFLSNKEDSSLDDLFFCLRLIAFEICVLLREYLENYKKFLAKPRTSVLKHTDSFIRCIEIITNSNMLYNEFFANKDFFRAVTSLEFESVDNKIKDCINSIRKKHKKFLEPELIKDLLTANKEIDLLFDSVRGIKDISKKKEATIFFKENRTLFKIITAKDLNKLNITSHTDSRRDAKRLVFRNKASKFGKTIGGSPIAVILGIETEQNGRNSVSKSKKKSKGTRKNTKNQTKGN